MPADEPRRPDPEALLAAANKASRGRLKVFLGMAPGVGKTYEMLRGMGVMPRRPLKHKDRTRPAGHPPIGRTAADPGFPSELSLVRADASLLEQVVVNILENAIAYSPPGAQIEMAAYEDRGNVVISIEDEGRGIPAAELERVFEKFRRMEEPTDRPGGWSGSVDRQGLHRRQERAHRRGQSHSRRKGHAHPDQPAQGGPHPQGSSVSSCANAS